MAGSAVNLSGQINQLANSILQPATLSQTQTGLLGQLDRQMNPRQAIDMESADGIRAGINAAIQRGDVNEATMLQKVLTQKMGDDRAKEVAKTSADSRVAVADINKRRAIEVQGMKDVTKRWETAQNWLKMEYQEAAKDGRNTALIDGRRDIQEMKLVEQQAAATLAYERAIAKIDKNDTIAQAKAEQKLKNDLKLVEERAKKQIEVYKANGKFKAGEVAEKALLQHRLKQITRLQDVTKHDMELLMGTIQSDERFSQYVPGNMVGWKSDAQKQKFARKVATEAAHVMRKHNSSIDPSNEEQDYMNESDALEAVLKHYSGAK